jgi:hypothetical protein
MESDTSAPSTLSKRRDTVWITSKTRNETLDPFKSGTLVMQAEI